ncbi:hypothetical protein [Bdellovibrio sp. HCB337]|uniref:hypothetical protein n=1 Tax=Bdellovibrio sp. HCB337 TaxID=3394358 RepID=UPI0039A4EB16
MTLLKTFTLVILATTAIQVQAKTAGGEIEALAMDDVNSVLIETYNEGTGRAEVIDADCKVVKSNASGITAFCSLTVDVQPNTEFEYRSEALCTSMGYHVSPDLKSAELFKGWDACIENVNGVTEY